MIADRSSPALWRRSRIDHDRMGVIDGHSRRGPLHNLSLGIWRHEPLRLIKASRRHRAVVMTLQQREVACALLIDTRGHLLLQRRDDIPSILQPGKVGLFGGHREGNETYLQCVVREIYEEI